MPLGAPRVALVGYGGWGPNLARVLAELGHLSAIYDHTADARARAQALYPSVPCYKDWRMAEANLDAAVFATPATTHAVLAQAAMQAGLDVFVEKPFAMTVADALALLDASSRTGRIAMVGHLLLYHPAILAIKSAVDAHRLGPLRRIISARHNFGLLRSNEDVIFSLGPHDVAAIMHLTGTLPTHVAARGAHILGRSTSDTCEIELTFSPTLSARVSLSWMHPIKEQKLIVQGTQAAMVFNDVHKHLHLQPLPIHIDSHGQVRAVRTPYRVVNYARDEPLGLEMRGFIDAIRTRKAPVANAQHALDVVRVLAAAQSSAAQGGVCIALSEPSPAARGVQSSSRTL